MTMHFSISTPHTDMAPRQAFLYDQVSRHILNQVRNGVWKPGDRIPSLRKLSKQLKVSISTVNQAYLTLEQQGVLKAKPQSGFYVRQTIEAMPELPQKTTTDGQPSKIRFDKLFEEIFQSASDPNIAPLGAATPSPELMPTKGLLRATHRAMTRRPEAGLSYCFPPGDPDLRQQIARQYGELGLAIAPDDIIITNGATEALALSLTTLTRRGDIIAVESPTYFAVLRLIERMGLMAVEIDTDPRTGMCLDALENALQTMDIRAILSVPNFNNPVGSLMPDEHKKALAALTVRYQTPLIEDDIYGELYFGDQRPGIIKAWDQADQDNQWVLSCSSLSKTLAPGYRIGWVIAPKRYRTPILELKQALSSAVASVPQLAVSEFLRSGEYERLLVRSRRTYRKQVQHMRYLLARHLPPGARITDPEGGYVLWVELPGKIDSLEVFNLAMRQHISIAPGLLFSATRRYRNFIRINCSAPPGEEIEDAVAQLGEIVREMMTREHAKAA